MENTNNPYAPPQSAPQPRPEPETFQLLPHISDTDVKALSNRSYSIRFAGIVCVFITFLALVSARFDNASTITIHSVEIDHSLAHLTLILASIVTSYSLLKRPTWGQPVGIVYCILAILTFNTFLVVIAVLTILALANAGPLFGPEKIQHIIISTEHRQRRIAQRFRKQKAKLS